MAVEKICCPELYEAHIRSGERDVVVHSEVFVRFDEEENPVGVMCGKYDDGKKRCEITQQACIYRGWKKPFE